MPHLPGSSSLCCCGGFSCSGSSSRGGCSGCGGGGGGGGGGGSRRRCRSSDRDSGADGLEGVPGGDDEGGSEGQGGGVDGLGLPEVVVHPGVPSLHHQLPRHQKQDTSLRYTLSYTSYHSLSAQTTETRPVATIHFELYQLLLIICPDTRNKTRRYVTL